MLPELLNAEEFAVHSDGEFSGSSAGEFGSTSDSGSTTRVECRSVGRSTGQSETMGASQALRPILEYRPSSVHDIEKLRYAAGLGLRKLGTGEAIVAVGMDAAKIVIPYVKARVPKTELSAFKRELYQKSDAALSVESAETVVRERQRKLIGTSARGGRKEEPERFREPAPSRNRTDGDDILDK